jgi:Isopropylmalate/homocitrate/citramalate synthases
MNIKKVKVTEVGPRDGFQSEKTILKTEDKIDVINNLIDSGFPRIEVSSFVSPKAIPQLADAATILENVKRNHQTTLAALVPNARGAMRAVDAKLDEICCFFICL